MVLRALARLLSIFIPLCNLIGAGMASGGFELQLGIIKRPFDAPKSAQLVLPGLEIDIPNMIHPIPRHLTLLQHKASPKANAVVHHVKDE